MNDIVLQLIISGAGIILAIISVLGILAKKLGVNPGNGCKGLDEKFTAQVRTCDERFLEIAEDRGEVKTSLKNFGEQLDRIEGRLKKRRAV